MPHPGCDPHPRHHQLPDAYTDSKYPAVRGRIRVTLEPGASDVSVDLRTKPNEPGLTITTPRKVEVDGKVGLLVEDEPLEG
jgi:hypothetical protein